MGMGKGKGELLRVEGCSFSGFSFSECVMFYFTFENQNDRCDKQQNVFYQT